MVPERLVSGDGSLTSVFSRLPAEASLPEGEQERLLRARLVAAYFKCGSVEEALATHADILPVSDMTYRRWLRDWGVVPTAFYGRPRCDLSKVLPFFDFLARVQGSVETVYKWMPAVLKEAVSVSSLHRVLDVVRRGEHEVYGTALMLSPEGRPDLVLTGRDVGTPRPLLGKPFGAVSFPMGFSGEGEARERSILRILQREVFTREVMWGEGDLMDVTGESPEPFMYLDLLNLRVAVYRLELSGQRCEVGGFSSYKLDNFRYREVGEVVGSEMFGSDFRIGMADMAREYARVFLRGEVAERPVLQVSCLNRELALV